MRSSFLFLSLALSLTVSAAPSATVSQSDGCGKTVPSAITPGKSKNLTIESGGLTRSYRIHVPESYQTDVPVPLILSFHGRGKDSAEQELLSQFSNSSYGFEGISVYPDGVPWTKKDHPQQWEGDPDAPTNIDDVQFTSDLIDHLLDRYCLDPNRVYAAGKSNGGGFVGLLACDPVTSAKIAAFAPVSAAVYVNATTGQLNPCNPTKSRTQIPIMEFHGFKDTTINYTGGTRTRSSDPVETFSTEPVPQFVDDWAKRNGFDPNANKTSKLCTDGIRDVTRYIWNDVVVHYNYTNLAHDWPSPFINDDTDGTNIHTCAEGDATRIILDWFAKWSL